MTESKNTKRALYASVISMLLCVTMLIGSTFAWFTDTVTTGVNTIQAGTLDIDLVDKDGDSLVGQTVKFVDDEGNALADNYLWEPGCRVLLQKVGLKNNGNLHAKYKVVISGTTGDIDLAEVIDVYETVDGTEVNLGTLRSFLDKAEGVKEGNIAPNETLYFGELKLVMQESADNDYQGKSISDIAITVYATQATVENDSFDNQYDANAKNDLELSEQVTVNGSVVEGEVVHINLNEETGDVNIPANGKTYILDWDSGDTSTTNALTSNRIINTWTNLTPNPGTYFEHSIIVNFGAKVVLNGVNIRTTDGEEAIQLQSTGTNPTYIYVADGTKNWLTGKSGIGIVGTIGAWEKDIYIEGGGYLQATATASSSPAIGPNEWNDGSMNWHINVNDLLAVPSEDSAGIGGGGNCWQAFMTLEITGGTVRSFSSGNAAAIGGAYNLNTNAITSIKIKNDATVVLSSQPWVATYKALGSLSSDGCQSIEIDCTADVTEGTYSAKSVVINHTDESGTCSGCGEEIE